ncbi:MAG: DNA polymerase IV [Lachnospiraceae bacterium]|nr:DNA polymerase IV [Lachnospiraceae bacterium]
MGRLIFHIDVNSAFLSWEAAYRIHHLNGKEDLREIDAAIGGDIESRRGIILAKSLSAKKYGIKTGESISEALKKCPHLCIVPPHYQLYDRCSKAFIEILKEYSPDVEQFSIDEAFIDMTGTKRLWGEAVTVANMIRKRISRELGFTVNVGISVNKLLAKMASEFRKPDLVHTLFPEEIPAKMWPLPIGELYFVGNATFKKLHALGIRTIGDLAHFDIEILKQHLKSHGELIWNNANGHDVSPVTAIAPANKGYGNSTNIAFDVTDAATAELILLSLAESVGMRLRRDGVKIEVVAIGIKAYDFSYVSHQKTLRTATNITGELYQAAVELFRGLWDFKTPIRHLGLHVSRVKAGETARQLSLFDIPDSPLHSALLPGFVALGQVDTMADLIRNRYGIDALKRAAFVRRPFDHVSGGIAREKHTVDYAKIVVR